MSSLNLMVKNGIDIDNGIAITFWTADNPVFKRQQLKEMIAKLAFIGS
jgi:hypothetical protein